MNPTLRRVSGLMLLLLIMACAFAPLLANHDPSVYYLDSAGMAPCRKFYLGTDSLGRDIFSLLLFGGRTSLLIGFLSALLSILIATVYGSVSGLLPSWADAIMMRIAAIAGSIPSVLTALFVASLFRAQSIVSVTLVIGCTGWFSMARLIRGEVRQLRARPYMEWARLTRLSHTAVVTRHLMPNILPTITYAAVTTVGACITAEATLSFLGLGLPVDEPSIGSMLANANAALLTGEWWSVVFPGLFLVVLLFCLASLTKRNPYQKSEQS